MGGGFISFEFAHFAARLGPAAGTTILEVAPRPLGPFDAEMVDALVAGSRAEGIDIQTGVQIEAVEALRGLGDRTIITALSKLLNSQDEDLLEAVETTIEDLELRE